MSFYSRVIFPRLCDLVLKNQRIAEKRQKLLVHARGNILEIGVGSGLNLPHYPEGIRHITAVDPNAGMHPLARRRSRQTAIEVEQRMARCENLPFERDTFDCIVSTFTLCSIQEVDQAVGEVYRVLKPGGQFLYLEHGLVPDPAIQRWQRRLSWLQQKLGDGCRLDRPIHQVVRSQPFASFEGSEEFLKGTPKTHGYLYRGMATK